MGYALPIRPIYQRRRNHALGKRPLAAAAGEHVPLARRFADGLAVAAWTACPGTPATTATLAGARSAGPARPAAFARLGAVRRQWLRPARRPRAVCRRRDCARQSRQHAAGTLDAAGGYAQASARALRQSLGSRAIRQVCLARCRLACRRNADRRADFADHPHGALRGSPRRPHARLHAAGRPAGRLPEPRRGHRRHGRRARHARDDRGLSAAVGLSPPALQGHARPRRDRGQPAALGELEGTGRQHHDALRRSPPFAAGDREIHDRRPAHGHGRRQPHRLGRGEADRQPLPPPPRPAAQPGGLLEQPAVAVLLVLRPVRRPHEPGPAGRRGPSRESVRIGNGVHATARRRARRPGWSIASSATCWWT